MKLKFKNILLIATLGAAGVTFSSCNSWLDLKPISQITPDGYYQTPAQVQNYLNNYYTSFLIHPYNMGNSSAMFHNGGYDTGMNQLDNNTDIVLVGGGSTRYFGDLGQWLVGTGRQLRNTFFARIRIANYFFEQVNQRIADGTFADEASLREVNHYLGEMYFFRAVTYYNALVTYGDFPIITTVLPDRQEELVEASKRAPRNEVARFILEDLDQAISLLQGKNEGYALNGRRVNKETAYLFKSRVALYEGTFEKYHRGSGRVPGDPDWPGAKMSYNQGKSFDIDGEITYFLTQAKEAAKVIADATPLTTNSHQINPELGEIYNWNPYFEMFGQNDLSNVPEVLMWREYSFDRGVKHRVGYRTLVGDNEGYTRQFVESFLYKDGMPSYAPGKTFDDTSIDAIKEGKDERLQLFVWGESTPTVTDLGAATRTPGTLFGRPSLLTSESQIRSITGYQSRKYFTYESTQTVNDEGQGVTGAPMFRAVEAYLNYIEADIELKNGGQPDGTAMNYWEAIRTRAGFEAGSVTVSVNNTDLSQEEDFGVYSGGKYVDEWTYSIRRERLNELFGEGLRYTDLIRWRSFDQLVNQQVTWIPEGINLWGEGSTFVDGYFREIDGQYYEKQYTSVNEVDEATGAIISSVQYELNDPIVNGSIVTKDAAGNPILNPDGSQGYGYKYTPLPTEDEPNPVEIVSPMRLIKVGGEDDAVVSGPKDPRSGSKTDYVRPLCRVNNTTNQLYDGYEWHEAYYLCPMGVDDMRYASPDEDVATTYLYQNINWPDAAGSALK